MRIFYKHDNLYSCLSIKYACYDSSCKELYFEDTDEFSHRYYVKSDELGLVLLTQLYTTGYVDVSLLNEVTDED